VISQVFLVTVDCPFLNLLSSTICLPLTLLGFPWENPLKMKFRSADARWGITQAEMGELSLVAKVRHHGEANLQFAVSPRKQLTSQKRLGPRW
jgi:hypothetical protein